MATKQDCIAAAMKGGLSKAEAETAVSAMFEDKRLARAAVARGAEVSEEAALAKAWAVRMDDAAAAAAIARKRAAVNALRRDALESGLARVKEQGGTAYDFLEGLMVGSNKRFEGARNSIANSITALRRDFQGALINDLEALETRGVPARKLLLMDEGFGKDVVREVITPDSTGDADARAVADLLSRHMEKARLRMNEAGASIGRLEGYMPQSHDAWKMTSGGAKAAPRWIDFIRERLDTEKTFGLDAAAAATPEGQTKIQDFLTATWDNILMGKDRVTAAEKGERTGPASLADRVARHRVLHFKDADAYMEYQATYGRGSALTGVLDHLSGAARSTALMERLGTNPEMMLQSLMAQETRELRAAEAGGTAGREEMKALARLKQGLAQGAGINNIGNWWAVLSGQVSVPVNVGAARACAVLRTLEGTGKLGGAALSAVTDAPTKAAGMRVHGLSWPEAMARSVAQYFQGYGDKNKKALCRDMGVMLDDTLGEMRLRWNEADDLPAVAAKWQDRFFRWSGLNYITEVGKAGYAMWFSGHMGEATVKPWAEVDKTRRATLQFHGITETNWNLVRLMTEKHPDGRTLLVPRKADDIPDATLRAHLTDEIAEIRKAADGDTSVTDPAEARLLDRKRNELRGLVMGMITDETQSSILEPDVKTRALMTQGSRPGTLLGEFLRFASQFRSFPFVYMQRILGGERWKRADLAAEGRYDVGGAVGFGIAMMTFGYLASVLKDMSRGRGPKDPARLETWFAAAMQSGGLGILGDFFFSAASRTGGSVAGALAGPALGDLEKPVNAVRYALRGNFGDAGEELLRMGMDTAPMVNLWYTREALNWLVFYHLREMVSPGTLARSERRLKKEYGQDMYFRPSLYIRKGGGFR